MTRRNNQLKTVPAFKNAKGQRDRLVVLTAYDFLTAQLFDRCGIDAILVGDTLGVVVQGRPNTLRVTIDDIIYHTEIVSRGAPNTLIVADMPFMTYQADNADAVRNAGRLIQEGCADAVKLEGGIRSEAAIRAIVQAQVPVMGHIGLTPQSANQLGEFKAQRDVNQLIADAKAVERAGAFSVVLETMPSDIARQVTEAISIPTIGIGAGPHCDGQVLVWQDAFGLTVDFKAKYVKHFANVHDELTRGVQSYCEEVRSGVFPGPEHSYK